MTSGGSCQEHATRNSSYDNRVNRRFNVSTNQDYQVAHIWGILLNLHTFITRVT